MKIRIIQPSQLNEEGKPTKYEKLFLPTLTIATLAGLTPEGVDIGITNEFVEEVDFDEQIDLAVITAQTSQALRAYQIGDEFRKRGTKTILGGIHVSMCPDEASTHFDSIFIGEAEDLWGDVIGDLNNGGLKPVYRAEKKPELSKLVLPRFDLFNYDHYVIPPFAKTPLIPIQTSRGCPHNCDFCAVASFLGHKMRQKPVANVIKEIEFVEPSRVFFSDDNIIGNPEYSKELFTAIKPMKLRWACQMSTRAIDNPELIDLAAESGCHENFVGIESIDAENLKSINKGFNKTERYAELFTRLKQVGILAQASVVFGLDYDTKESLKRTIETVLSWDINYLYIFILTPLPGTPMYTRVKGEGRLLTDDWSSYDMINPIVDFKNISVDDLLDAMWDAYERFYSARNIFRRVGRFKKEYIKFFPRDFVLEEVFFQLSMRKAIQKRAHPFSLGLKKE